MKKLSLFSTILILVCSLAFSATTMAQATLISQFDFDGNLNDDFGNSVATEYNSVNTSYSSGSLYWEADSLGSGGGLLVEVPDAGFTENHYSIAIEFQYSEVFGYRKILDFRELLIDEGVYVDESLRLYFQGLPGSTTLLPDTNTIILITRDSATDSTELFIVYPDSLSLQSALNDNVAEFVANLSGSDRILHFFHDDSLTTSEFSQTGMVAQIRIWNGIADLADVVSRESGYPRAANLRLYPNPAGERIIIRNETGMSGEFRMTDGLGKLIRAGYIPGETEYEIPTDDLAAGIYLMSFAGQHQKLVKE